MIARDSAPVPYVSFRPSRGGLGLRRPAAALLRGFGLGRSARPGSPRRPGGDVQRVHDLVHFRVEGLAERFDRLLRPLTQLPGDLLALFFQTGWPSWTIHGRVDRWSVCQCPAGPGRHRRFFARAISCCRSFLPGAIFRHRRLASQAVARKTEAGRGVSAAGFSYRPVESAGLPFVSLCHESVGTLSVGNHPVGGVGELQQDEVAGGRADRPGDRDVDLVFGRRCRGDRFAVDVVEQAVGGGLLPEVW